MMFEEDGPDSVFKGSKSNHDLEEENRELKAQLDALTERLDKLEERIQNER